MFIIGVFLFHVSPYTQGKISRCENQQCCNRNPMIQDSLSSFRARHTFLQDILLRAVAIGIYPRYCPRRKLLEANTEANRLALHERHKATPCACLSPTGLDIRFYLKEMPQELPVRGVSPLRGSTYVSTSTKRSNFHTGRVSVPYGARHTFLQEENYDSHYETLCQSPTGLDIRFYPNRFFL